MHTCRFTATVVDVLTPIAILVIGLLGVFSILSLTPAVTWGLVGAGSSYLFCTLFLLVISQFSKKPVSNATHPTEEVPSQKIPQQEIDST